MLLHIIHDLFHSGIINVEEYLKSPSSLVSKIPSQSCCGNEPANGIRLIIIEKTFFNYGLELSFHFFFLVKIERN